MAARTYYHYDVAVNGFGKMDNGSAPTAANTNSKLNWSGGNNCGVQVGTYKYANTITTTDCDGAPNGPAPGTGNGWRSLNTLNGTFSAGTWTFTLNTVSSVNSASITFDMLFKFWRSVNADGSGATALGAAVGDTTFPTLSTTPYDVTGTLSLSAVTFSNEYLFVTLNTDIVNALPAGPTGTQTFRVGSSSVVTPNFAATYNDTLSEPGTPTDSYSSAGYVHNPTLAEQPPLRLWGAASLVWGSQDSLLWGFSTLETFATVCTFVNPLTEYAVTDWGTPGINWGVVGGVWNGSLIEVYNTTQVFSSIPVVETGTAADSLAAGLTIPTSLSESRTAADSLGVGLTIEVAKTESAAPTDSLTTNVTFALSLTEALADYWGTPGILWGASTGNWGNQALDSLSSQQIFVSSLSEAGTPTDSLIGNTIFPNALSEVGSATDSFVPNLVIPVSLTELGSALDSLVAAATLNVTVVESLAAYWGTPGILWGATTGNWGGDVEDSVSVTVVFNTFPLESVTALDSLATQQVMVSSLAEPASAVDTLLAGVIITSTLSEAGGAIDLVAAAQVFNNLLLETRSADVALSFIVIGSTPIQVIAEPQGFFGTLDVKSLLGVDISSFPDFDPSGILVSGISALKQRVAKRLTNPRGSWFWSPDDCTDARQYLNELMTKERLAVIRNEIEREILREEVVKTANADLQFDSVSMKLTIEVSGVTSDGPFKFTFDVTSSNLLLLS